MKGRISTEFTCHCGTCPNEFTSSEDGLKNFKIYLREKGWINTREHSWQCPECKQSEVDKEKKAAAFREAFAKRVEVDQAKPTTGLPLLSAYDPKIPKPVHVLTPGTWLSRFGK